MFVHIKVKMAPRYKVAYLVHVGPYTGQNMWRAEFSQLVKWAKKRRLRTGKWIMYFIDEWGTAESRLLLSTLPPSVVIFVLVRIERFPFLVLGAASAQVYRLTLFVVESLGALNLPAIIVGTGQLHVVVDDDGIAPFRLHHRGHDIALRKFSLGVGVVRAKLRGEVMVDPERAVGERHDFVEIITAPDVHPAKHRSQGVGGVLAGIVASPEIPHPNRMLPSPSKNQWSMQLREWAQWQWADSPAGLPGSC